MPDKTPVTRGVRMLDKAKVMYRPVVYDFVLHGGTRHAAEVLGVDEHCVIKTLALQPDSGKAILVLMHGDLDVSTKNLARQLEVKQIVPCTPADAERITGYQTGGISPFGTRTPMRVYVERSILALPELYINGGKRGFLVVIAPAILTNLLQAQPVDVGI